MSEETNHVRQAIRTARHSISQLIVQLNALDTTFAMTEKQMDKEDKHKLI